MQNLIKQIEYNHGHFHRNELEEIIARQEEAVPELLRLMADVRDNPKKSLDDPKYFGHIYATYLLAQFRVKEAYPIFIDILSMPDEIPHNLYGDTITEDAGRILASICGDNIEPIKALIEDVDVDEYVRMQAAIALNILVSIHRLSRESVLAYYKELLEGKLKDGEPSVIDRIMRCSNDLSDLEEESLFAGRFANQPINDTINELKGWACFHLDKEERRDKPGYKNTTESAFQPREVQRNEFCPCGSGMKYKKCCGKQFEKR